MDFALPADQLLTTPASNGLEVELSWRCKIEPARLTGVEIDLLMPVLPELISELMMTRDLTDGE